MAAAEHADLVVVGEQPRPAARSSGTVRSYGAERKVTALFDATEAGRRALAAALSLAQGEPQLLSLLVRSTSETGLQELRQLAARVLGVRPDLPRLVPVRSPEAGELVREARRQDSRALVLSVRSLPEARTQIRVLLQTSGCPLVLLF